MDNITFGVTMLVVGMGGTLVVLYGLTWLIRGLTHFFPVESAEKEKSTKGPS